MDAKRLEFSHSNGGRVTAKGGHVAGRVVYSVLLMTAIINFACSSDCAADTSLAPQFLDIGDTRRILTLEFIDDGGLLLATLEKRDGSGFEVRTWNAANGSVVKTLNEARVVTTSPPGGIVVTASTSYSRGDVNLTIWTDALSKPLRAMKLDQNVTAAISPDERLAAIRYSDAHAEIVSLENNAQPVALPEVRDCNNLLFAPDSKHLAVIGDRCIRMWETDVLKKIWQTDFEDDPGVDGLINSVFSRDGRVMYVASGKNLHALDARSGVSRRSVKLSFACNDLMLTSDELNLIVRHETNDYCFTSYAEAVSAESFSEASEDFAFQSGGTEGSMRYALAPSGKFAATGCADRAVLCVYGGDFAEKLSEWSFYRAGRWSTGGVRPLAISKLDFLAFGVPEEDDDDGRRLALLSSNQLKHIAAESDRKRKDEQRIADSEARKREAEERRLAAESMRAEQDRKKQNEWRLPPWEHCPDLAVEVARFRARDLSLADYVRFGSVENAAKWHAGDRFDREDAEETGRVHQAELEKKQWRMQSTYTWPDFKSDPEGVVTVEAELPMQVNISAGTISGEEATQRQYSSPAVRSGVFAADYEDRVFVLMKSARLEECPPQQKAELLQHGAVLYAPERMAGGRMRVSVRGDRDLLKQVARNTSECLLNLRLSGLRLQRQTSRRFYRIDVLDRVGGACNSAEFGLPGWDLKEAPSLFQAERPEGNETRCPVANLEEVELVHVNSEGRKVLFHWRAKSAADQ